MQLFCRARLSWHVSLDFFEHATCTHIPLSIQILSVGSKRFKYRCYSAPNEDYDYYCYPKKTSETSASARYDTARLFIELLLVGLVVSRTVEATRMWYLVWLHVHNAIT